ncbi:MAG: hypothetical protein NTW93_02135, partial [Phycisphaerae bacterium]|nr:hypothetical protein [Phycisphaerae bacterium]
KELHRLGIADAIIAEPLGGAHRNIHDTVYNVEQYIVRTLRELKRVSIENLLDSRYKKLRTIGNTATKMEIEEVSKLPAIEGLPASGVAAEKFIKAGRIKKPAPVEVNIES